VLQGHPEAVVVSAVELAPPDCCALSLHDALPISRILAETVAQGFSAGVLPSRLSTSHASRCSLREPGLASCEDHGAELLVGPMRSEEHTSELQSRENLVCRLLLEKKNSNGSGVRV